MRFNQINSIVLVIALFAIIPDSFAAHAITKPQHLLLLTSYPLTYIKPIKRAFEARYPAYRLEVLYKKTPAAIAHVDNRRPPHADLLMVSATDSLVLLQQKHLLQRYHPAHLPRAPAWWKGPRDDSDTPYTTIALSGYGILWNRHYLEAHHLPVPRTWKDLIDPRYAGHIGFTSPSRSGTAHVIVENLLQSMGWEQGWAYLLRLAGNLSTITARSFGVRDDVARGFFGIGLTIDFLALISEHQGYPVEFSYLSPAPFLPVGVAMLTSSSHPAGARRFVDFLLSPPGQSILMGPSNLRFPVDARLYQALPPLLDRLLQKAKAVLHADYDTALSARRYHLVNTLFDEMITYRLPALKDVWNKIDSIEKNKQGVEREQTGKYLSRAVRILTRVPVSAQQARDPEFTGKFGRPLPGIAVPRSQRQEEENWHAFSVQAVSRATALVSKAEALTAGP